MSQLLIDTQGYKVKCDCGEVTSYHQQAQDAWEHQKEHEDSEHENGIWLTPIEDMGEAEKTLCGLLGELVGRAYPAEELTQRTYEASKVVIAYAAEVWEAGHLHEHMAWHCVDCQYEDGVGDDELKHSREHNPYLEGGTCNDS